MTGQIPSNVKGSRDTSLIDARPYVQSPEIAGASRRRRVRGRQLCADKSSSQDVNELWTELKGKSSGTNSLTSLLLSPCSCTYFGSHLTACKDAAQGHFKLVTQSFQEIVCARQSAAEHIVLVQVIRETMPALKVMGACQGDCWLWPSITQVRAVKLQPKARSTQKPYTSSLLGCACKDKQAPLRPCLDGVMCCAALVPDSRDPGRSHGAAAAAHCA